MFVFCYVPFKEGVSSVSACSSQLHSPPQESLQDRGTCTFWFTVNISSCIQDREKEETGGETPLRSCYNVSDTRNLFVSWMFHRLELRIAKKHDVLFKLNILIIGKMLCYKRNNILQSVLLQDNNPLWAGNSITPPHCRLFPYNSMAQSEVFLTYNPHNFLFNCYNSACKLC